MNRPYFSYLPIIGIVIIFFLSACGPAKSTPTPTPTIEPTATIAPTVPGPTYTSTPIPSPTPTATQMPTSTETPTQTATPEPFNTSTGGNTTPTELSPDAPPQITAIEDTNCRIKPKKESDGVGFFLKGMVAEVLGVDSTGIWAKIPNPTEPGYFCWVWTGTAKITGSLDSVPVY